MIHPIHLWLYSRKNLIRWILSYWWLLQYSSNFFFNSWFSLKIFLNLKLSFKVVYDNFLNTNTRNKKEHAKTNPTETHTSYDTLSIKRKPICSFVFFQLFSPEICLGVEEMLNAIKSAKWKTNIFSISNKAAETRSKSNFDKPVEVIAGIIRTNLRSNSFST